MVPDIAEPIAVPNSAPLPYTPAAVNRQFVLERCAFFTTVQLWPVHSHVDPARWLSNFTDSEIEFAVHLLNGFLYFSDNLVDELFAGAFQALSRSLLRPVGSFLAVQTAWRSFVDSIIVTHVTGEDPSITDSGIAFARKARQVLGWHPSVSIEKGLESTLNWMKQVQGTGRAL